MDTLIYRIMAENNFVNLFSFSCDVINGVEERDLQSCAKYIGSLLIFTENLYLK